MVNNPDFETLYRHYYPKVLKLCLGYTGDYPQAQDLTQESFVRVCLRVKIHRIKQQLTDLYKRYGRL